MATEADRAAMQAEFDAFIADAPKRAERMRKGAEHFADSPEVLDLMLRIAESEDGYSEFAGARFEPACAD